MTRAWFGSLALGGVLAVTTVALTASAGTASTDKAKTIDASLTTPDGRIRTYHLYVPSTISAGTSGVPVPLLVALHGGLGSGVQFERNSGFDDLAEAHRFIVVYPDGIGAGASGTALRTWNGGACCGPATRQNVDDVGFIRMLIERLRSEYSIDPTRVFAAGHSNGGILAYRLACELSDEIVAIGVQSSTLELAHCHPSRPVSVVHIHGTADHNLPINGGRGPQSVSGVAFRPPRDGAKAMAAADQCRRRSTSKDRANPDVTIETWRSCTDRTEVRFLTVEGASHAWMGHPTAAPRLVGAPYMKLDSSRVIWEFLVAHPRT